MFNGGVVAIGDAEVVGFGPPGDLFAGGGDQEVAVNAAAHRFGRPASVQDAAIGSDVGLLILQVEQDFQVMAVGAGVPRPGRWQVVYCPVWKVDLVELAYFQPALWYSSWPRLAVGPSCDRYLPFSSGEG